MNTSQNIVGNHYDKYGTKNPIARRLMEGFLGAVGDLYAQTQARSVLEVGCGEGHLAHELVSRYGERERFVALDLSLEALAPNLHPSIDFREGSIYELPFPNDSFDLLVCCEVLEHLEDPERGLRELRRVTRRAVLLSTPREPLWRALNLARGKYVGDWGNTPGHLQHFSRGQLRRMVSKQLRIVEERLPPPWTVLLGHK